MGSRPKIMKFYWKIDLFLMKFVLAPFQPDSV